MIAYAIRRVLLIIPTLFAIMVVNFVIVQAAPGGPVEQMISRLKGSNVSATERVSGGSGELKTQTGGAETGYRGARGLDPALIKAPDRASLVAHTRALDRVLQYGYYVIPHYHVSAFRVAYWDKFRRPAISPKFAVGLDTWWVDPKAEQSVEARKGEVTK